MSDTFVELPVELSGATLKARIYARMEEVFPGWRPNPNNPEKWMIDGLVDELMVPLGQMAADVAAEIFYQYGLQIVKVLPHEAKPATVRSTWTVIDEQGYEIPAGTQVEIATSGNTGEGFRVVNTVIVPKGSVVTEPGEVLLEATTPGTGANRLTEGAKLTDSLKFIEPGAIVLVGETTGGEDAEEPTEFLNRLAETMQTLSPRPILPSDGEILARNIPGVGRSLALDLFNPETDDPEDPATWLSERTMSIALCDAEGLPCTEEVKDAVKADLEAKRETNFVFFVLDPDYTELAAKCKVVALPGFDKAVVAERVALAIKTAWEPDVFGIDPSTNSRAWQGARVVRYQDIVTIVNNQQGVDHYTELKIGKEGGALAEVDVALTGPAPLTKPGKVEVAGV